MTVPNLDPEEILPAVAVAKLRHRRWLSQSEYVLNRSAFSQWLWKGIRGTLAEIYALPPSSKSMLRTSQSKYPTFGDYRAARSDTITRLHRACGTTGQPINAGRTQTDAIQTDKVGARSAQAGGLKPGELIAHCLNYQMWMGGVTDHLSMEAAGATVDRFGLGDTRHQVRTIIDLGITAIHATLSYPAVLEQMIADHFPKLNLADLAQKLDPFGDEVGPATATQLIYSAISPANAPGAMTLTSSGTMSFGPN